MPPENVLFYALRMLEVRGATVGVRRDGLTEAVSLVVPFTGPAPKHLRGLLIFLSRSLNIVAVKAVTEEVTEEGAVTAILVHPGNPTAQGTRTLITLEHAGVFRSECFKESFFWNDLLGHELVPLHERAVRPDLVKKKYGLGIPVIKTSDSVARYHDYRPGEIIKVTREGGGIAFRRVEAG